MLQGLGTQLTLVDTVARATPGDTIDVYDSSGRPARYRYIKVNGGETLSKGKVAALKASTNAYESDLVANAPAARVLGVAQWDIADGSYGWVLVRGFGVVLSGAALTANAAVTTGSTAGKVIDFAAGAEHQVVGVATALAGASDTLTNAYINVN